MTQSVFVISKPMVPPWNDSGKNIAMELVTHGNRYAYRVLTTKDFQFENQPGISYERIYPSGGTFQAGLKQNVKVMFSGLRKKGATVYHYFFAPNKLSATAGRVQRMATRVKTVQTFCSRPAHYDNMDELIFTDKVIVLSNHTREQLLNAGVSPGRVVHIPPGIAPPAPITEEERANIRNKYRLGDNRVILFPGDYEFSDTANRVANAAHELLTEKKDRCLLFACRAKTEKSQAKKAAIQSQLRGLENRVMFLDEIDDMPRLVGAVDVVLLPQTNLYAKMDIPLVLLEAMAHGIPLVVADSGPLQELATQQAGLAVSGDTDDIAHQVNQIMEDSVLAERLGKNGKQLTHSRYNSITMAKEIEKLYDELLETDQ
ncbi:MAG: glycosyltransferase family 4 protein [Deltaproteobacteria bacterium]|nr:glycosyltransferase family 4 protein [Deltaproteobacteria bacterium]